MFDFTDAKGAKTVTGVFTAALFLISAASVFWPQKEFSDTENRSLTKRPEFTAESFLSGKFGKQYEEALSDQFPMRNTWISVKTEATRALLMEESKGIYFAKDEYLIERHAGEFSTDLAKKNIGYLAAFVEQMEELVSKEHITCMLVPNAVEILTDKLPFLAPESEESVYLKEVAEALPDGVFTDLTPVLKSHTDEQLFYRTDHHWTTLSAFYAFQQWEEKMGLPISDKVDYDRVEVTDSFMGTISAKLNIRSVTDTIEVWNPETLAAYESVDLQGNKAELLQEEALSTRDKYGVFFGGNQPMLRITAKNPESAKGKGKLLVLKDSYANCFVPFLLEQFEEIDLVDLRYYNQPLSALLETEGYTDVLVLYNLSGFASDTSLVKLGV